MTPAQAGYRGLLAGLGLIAVFVVPTWPPHSIAGANSFLLSIASLAVIYAIVATGTAMFTNLTGLPSLAQAGLWGIGAYASGVAMAKLHVGFWPSLAFAAVVPAIVAFPIAIVALRTSGMAFLIVTIAFTEFIVLLLTNLEVTGGSLGLTAVGGPGAWFDTPQRLYYLFLGFLALALIACFFIGKSHFGERVRAIRDNEPLARALGLSSLWHRLVLLEISAVMVGLAGPLLLMQQQAITPDLFGSLKFIDVYLMVILGGAALLSGPLLGAWIVLFLPVWLGSQDPNTSRLIYGLLLVGAMLVLPRGLLGTLHDRVMRRPRQAPPEAEAGDEDLSVAPGLLSAPVARLRRRAADELGGEVLAVTGLKRWFGANRALDGVDMSVCRGEIRGIIGPNGSGKTTLLNCVSGFLDPTDGEIVFRGEDIGGHAPDAVARTGLVRTFQQPEAFESFTVAESCRLIARCAADQGNEGLPATPEEIMRMCRLVDVADLTPGELSYGQQRLLGVALALCRRPYVLMLDEPAAGLALTDAEALRDAILLARDAGVTVVVVDHDMSFLLPICDNVTVLDSGLKLADGHPEEVAVDEAVIAAYLGEASARRLAAESTVGSQS